MSCACRHRQSGRVGTSIVRLPVESARRLDAFDEIEGPFGLRVPLPIVPPFRMPEWPTAHVATGRHWRATQVHLVTSGQSSRIFQSAPSLAPHDCERVRGEMTGALPNIVQLLTTRARCLRSSPRSGCQDFGRSRSARPGFQRALTISMGGRAGAEPRGLASRMSMAGAISRVPRPLPAQPEQGDPDGARRRWPNPRVTRAGMVAPVPLEEIDHGAVAQAVDHVATAPPITARTQRGASRGGASRSQTASSAYAKAARCETPLCSRRRPLRK